jgi:hypothetical protein
VPPAKPPFAVGRRWIVRGSRAVGRRVWYDQDTRFEYEPDPEFPLRNSWHEIDPRHGLYRDVDPQTGMPVAGSEGRWRRLL